MATVKQQFGGLDDYLNQKQQTSAPLSTGAQSGSGVGAGSPGNGQGNQGNAGGPGSGIPTPTPSQQVQPNGGGTGFINPSDTYAANANAAGQLQNQLNTTANSQNNQATQEFNNAQSAAQGQYTKNFNDALGSYNKQKDVYNQQLAQYNKYVASLSSGIGNNKPTDYGTWDKSTFGVGAQANPGQFRAPSVPALDQSMGAAAYGNLQNDLNKAATYDKALQNGNGIAGLLQQSAQSGGTPYSVGANILDAGLLGGSLSGQSTQSGAYGQLMGMLGNDSMFGPGGPTPAGTGQIVPINTRPVRYPISNGQMNKKVK